MVLSTKTSKMSERIKPPDLVSCSHGSNAFKVCKQVICIICEVILTVTLRIPPTGSLWDVCMDGSEGGVCPGPEKAEKRKRDRKTTEGRERPLAVHGPAVRVVRGQGMFN